MTALATTPVQGDLLDELAALGNNATPLEQDSYAMFEAACRAVAQWRPSRDDFGWVNPNRVREYLTVNGELQIEARRYSSLWTSSCSKSGFMYVPDREDRVLISGPGSKNNQGKSVPWRRLRGGVVSDAKYHSLEDVAAEFGIDLDEANDPDYTITVDGWDLTPEQYDALFDRIADAAHALDEQVMVFGVGLANDPSTTSAALPATPNAGMAAPRPSESSGPDSTPVPP